MLRGQGSGSCRPLVSNWHRTVLSCLSPGSQSCIVKLAVRSQRHPQRSTGPGSLTQGQPEALSWPWGLHCLARQDLASWDRAWLGARRELLLKGVLLYGKGDKEDMEMRGDVCFSRGDCYR